ncbi:MAG: prepilin-type N-terminal cleavage/methylation domain-containing protein [Candidatus Methylacidiphilales bacterium]|nr:prepilin-type N-terminal cleavage/methylation domain-containing protein [Candidatus Methylacidiphilales bacterium]
MTATSRPSRRAFTLIELLVVMTIITVLAGITIGVMGNVQKKAATSRASVEIAAIETALERYKIDNGDYPVANGIAITSNLYSSNPSNATYTTSGRTLFTALMGRSAYSATANATAYIELKEGQVGSLTTNSYIQDPFGYAYGYFYDSAGNVNSVASAKSLFNQVVPDIWSTAGETGAVTVTNDGSANYARYLRWVTNWGSRQ